MKHGVYVGDTYPLLLGEGALLMKHLNPDWVLAQFDSRTARRNDVCQAYGWHVYWRNEFKIDEPETFK